MEVVTPRPQLTIRIRENKHNPVGRGNHTKTRDVPGTRGQPIVHPTPPEGTERIKKRKQSNSVQLVKSTGYRSYPQGK